MTLAHEALRVAFGAVLAPAAWLGESWGLVALSAVTGIVLLLGFRATSRPDSIRAAKRKVQANLLAVRIFRDDLTIVLRAQGRLFPALGRYMGNMTVPFLVLLVPFALLFGQLDARYATRALRPGEVTVVTAAGAVKGWRLDAAAGLSVETRGVHVPERDEVSWRVRAIEPGRHELRLVSGNRTVTKSVVVGAGNATPRRLRASVDSIFFSPTEAPLPAAAGLERIEVRLPGRGYTPFDLHWIVVFLLISATVAFGFRKRFGVEF